MPYFRDLTYWTPCTKYIFFQWFDLSKNATCTDISPHDQLAESMSLSFYGNDKHFSLVSLSIAKKILYFWSKNDLFSGIIISGGSPSRQSVEILRANGSYWCSLSDLPYIRWGHSQSGLVTCGGLGSRARKSYEIFSSGQWSGHGLQQKRSDHSSWISRHGVLLMGGYYSRTTTEIYRYGQSLPYFTLKYDT